ncbi:MAG: hypothetical protein LH478_05665 [Chitinophagaceae bacterium]|nr:hypothetical protein [Chitinophagaceae bacterium]
MQHTTNMLYKKSNAETSLLLKKGIWMYLFLLIFEGALRKWVLPGLATPLLIIRDPLAVWMLVMAYQNGLFKMNSFVMWMGAIGIIGIFTAVLFGHGNLFVALFGARILLIHFPLIFLIGKVFNYEDVVKMGKTILFISIPMALLVIMQFYSPQSAWVNRGVGGDMSGAGFDGAMGFFRPPATFSFITGTVSYYTLSASYVVFFWLNKKGINPLVLYAATAALIIVIPLSISRSLFFGVALCLVFTAIAISRKSEYVGKMIFGATIVFLVLSYLASKSFFATGTAAFTSRFETANVSEGGLNGVLIDRFFGGMFGALKQSWEQSFFGLGQGLGTNVGSMLTTGGMSFLVAEGEWGRVIGEMGPLMGLIIIVTRLNLSLKIAIASYTSLAKGNLLPWMLLSIILINLPQGQWAQPSILGFSVLVCGLAVAAIKGPTKKLT